MSYPWPTGNFSTATSYSTRPTTLSTASIPIPTTTSLPQYGSHIDATDDAPNSLQQPDALPTRTATTISVTGNYTEPFTGALGGSHLLVMTSYSHFPFYLSDLVLISAFL